MLYVSFDQLYNKVLLRKYKLECLINSTDPTFILEF